MSEENLSTGQDVSLDEQIEGILDEQPTDTGEENPDNTSEPEPQDNSNSEDENKPQIPDEFLNQDGTVNVDDLIKSYNELQPLLSQKEQWEQEKAQLQQQADYAKQLQEQAQAEAENLGYKNPEEYAFITEIANAQANEYLKYLHTVGEPDKVRGLLALYAKNPTPDLLERIEDEFSVDIVKHVSVLGERIKNQIFQK